MITSMMMYGEKYLVELLAIPLDCQSALHIHLTRLASFTNPVIG